MANKKYTPKTLASAVNRYFKSITRMVTLTELEETDQFDKWGHKIYKKVPIMNNLGQKVEIEEYVVPPTLSDLCLYLKIHRSTWDDYCKDEEFSDTTTHAGGRIRAYLDRQVLIRKDVKGIIFDLQNNHCNTEKTAAADVTVTLEGETTDYGG